MKMKKLWNKESAPFFVMAPMDDVTDIAFRQMFARRGVGRAKFLPAFAAKILPAQKNFVSFTEFVSADGLALADEKGKKKLMKKLAFKRNEHPIVAQIFGSNLENLKQAAKFVENLGFDGIDINMGCPDRSVEKTGSGSALIKNPEHAVQIVQRLKESVQIPVSVKTRIGYSKFDPEWIRKILGAKPAALTLHLRTRNEMSKVDAHWEIVPKILKIKEDSSPETVLICNGDIKSIQEAKEKIEKYKIDGVMIGRGLFGNPLFFLAKNPGKKERMALLKEHIKIFEKELLGINSYAVMKKHFKAYISNFEGAGDLRAKLMETNSPSETLKILKEF